MAEGVVARGKKTIIRWFERADVDKRQMWSKHTDPLLSHNDPRPMVNRRGTCGFWIEALAPAIACMPSMTCQAT